MAVPAFISDVVSGIGEWEDRAWFPPGPRLAICLSGNKSRLNALSDAELVEVAAAARRQTSWAQARELAAIAELAQRRNAEEDAGHPDYRVLSAHESVVEEVAAALTVTGESAATLVHLARRLATDLPSTREALETGRLDLPKARVICDLSDGLPDGITERLENAVLDRAPAQTTGQLRRRAKRIAAKLAPQQVENRTQDNIHKRRLELWETPAGTADLALTNLNPENAHAIFNKITAAAHALKQDGDDRPLHLIRADLATELLNGAPLPNAITTLLAQATQATQATPPPDPPPTTPANPEPEGTPAATANTSNTAATPAPEATAGNGESRAEAGDGTAGTAEAGGAASTLNPADTADTGDAADTPGNAAATHSTDTTATIDTVDTADVGDGGGAADADSADGAGGAPGPIGAAQTGGVAGAGGGGGVAQATSTSDTGETGGSGGATGAANARGNLEAVDPHDGTTGTTGTTGAGGVADGIDELDAPDAIGAGEGSQAGDAALVRTLARMVDQRLTAVADQARATGRLEVLAVLVGRAVQNIHDHLAPFRDIWCQATGPTPQAHGHPGYQPPAALRRLIEARHPACVFPTCNRRSHRCDLDHTIAYSAGLTCRCNLAPLCRRHHRTKQSPGWKLHQIWPGLLIWITPSGTWHITLPDQE